MTNEQKIKVFKKAIVLLKKRQQYCLCGALWDACGSYEDKEPTKIIHNKFPELLKYKPSIRGCLGAYWWPNGEIEPRIEVLKKAIKELKNEI